MTKYAAFILKIWRESEQSDVRIVLENIHSGERFCLNSAETLLKLLALPKDYPNGDTHETS